MLKKNQQYIKRVSSKLVNKIMVFDFFSRQVYLENNKQI